MRTPAGFDLRLAKTLTVIERAVRGHSRPVVLSSFGKDSLCLLALMEISELAPEIAYFELGVVAGAHRFARDFIARNLGQVTLLRPHRTAVAAGRGGADLGYEFDLSNGDSFMIVGATFIDRGQPFCGLARRLVKNGHHPAYDWTLVMSGRRRVDQDPTLGSLEISADRVSLPGGTEMLMPILDWTDEDVAYFLLTTGRYAPDWDRYELSDAKLRTRAATVANPDEVNICIRCLTVAEGQSPVCPLASAAAFRDHRLDRRTIHDSGAVPSTVML